MNRQPRARFSAVIAGTLLAASGCAVRGTSPADFKIGLDNAALFGKTVDTFTLPNGSTGAIRVAENRYSLKLQAYSRVIDFEPAAVVRFRSAQTVDGYTLIVLDKSQPACAYKTEVMAIKGSEVSAWTLGNCTAQPVATISSTRATFDFTEQARTTRYQFSNGKLLYGDLVTSIAPPVTATRHVETGVVRTPVSTMSAAVSATSTATGTATKGPVPSADPSVPERREPGKTAIAAARPTETRRSATLPAPALTFEAKERAPRTINLTQ